ncbi:MAG: PilZ domain-containing protein [Candidatus Ancaeobacter aquaticus]|nr:PilZ domain-containing protein [Candidatus Ancaeobacter aquaticus]
MKAYRERRKSPRIQVDGEMLLDVRSQDFIKANTINISSSGIHFMSAVAIPLFRELEITLTINHVSKNRNIEEIKCHSVVVRCEPKGSKWFDVALFFIDIPKESKMCIEKYIEHKVGAKKTVC